jgi:hypothetical protein
MTGIQPFPGGAQYASITLNGSGGGTAQIGPTRVREHWQIQGVAVSVDSDINESACSIYIGTAVGQATFVGNTLTGSAGDTCGCAGMDIQPGQQVFAEWTGGDVGATATMTVFGTYSIGSPS